MTPDDAGTVERFEQVDWSATGRRRTVPWRTALFLGWVLVVAASFAYDYTFVTQGERFLFGWDPHAVDWLYAVSLVAFVLYGLVPLARNPDRTRYHWRRFRGNRLAVAGLGWLVVFFVMGVLSPVLVGDPPRHTNALNNPPVGFAKPEILVGGCAGEVVDGMCQGSWQYPLGTTGNGRDVIAATVAGSHVALKIALIVATLIVPIATTVGTVAAQLGGRVDELLMRYIDIQGAIPPFFVYIVAQFLYSPTLALMVLIFGLLDWGGVARLVRAEALSKRREGYILAAKAGGSHPLRIVRKHVVPNVAGTILTAVTLQIPALVIIEATLSYLGLGDPRVLSWGQTIAIGMNDFPSLWWVPTVPVVVLALTVVSLNVVGDALRDVLDPEAQV